MTGAKRQNQDEKKYWSAAVRNFPLLRDAPREAALTDAARRASAPGASNIGVAEPAGENRRQANAVEKLTR